MGAGNYDCYQDTKGDCIMEEFYTYGEFHFTRGQVIWAIRNLDELSFGTWPTNPEGSNYTELPGVKKQGGEASFVRACGIAAEIEGRLEKTGVDGKLLVAELNGAWRAPMFEDLQWESQMALNYVSGWKPKKDIYSSYKAKRQWRERNK